jgi:tripartite-type tricarboxylate transporter receptor subunit TctC
VARHIGSHIPGRPSVVPQNKPGAGGLVMANNVYNIAARDGTVVALLPPSLAVEPLLGNADAKFDAQKFSWIGSMTKDLTPVCFSWRTSPIQTIEDAMKRRSQFGSTGQATPTTFYPRLLNALLQTKINVIMGYPDSGATGIALENGEIDGLCGLSFGTLKSAHPDWLRKKQITMLLQLSLQRNSEMPDVPSILDYTKDPTGRQIIEFVFGLSDMNRPVIAPPAIPPDRLQALRQAFQDTMKDPAFLADAKKTNLEVDPIRGEAIEAILKRVYATPAAIVKRVVQIRDGK